MKSHCVLAIGMFVASAGGALAAETEQMVRAIVEAGFVQQGNAGLDEGGNLRVARYGVEAGSGLQFGRLTWLHFIRYGVDDYDFSGGNDPWGKVEQLQVGGGFRWACGKEWTARLAGRVEWSAERGADWGDAATCGGAFTMEWQALPTLRLNLGAGVTMRLEDSVSVLPLVGLEWMPDGKWTVRLGSVPVSGAALAGAEVQYALHPKLAVAAGGLYQSRRFRLDDDGPVPAGIGEERQAQVRLRLAWNILPKLTAHVVGGYALAGKVKLEDKRGYRLGDDEYDPAPFVGVYLSGRY